MVKIFLILVVFILLLFYFPSFTDRSFTVSTLFKKEYYKDRMYRVVIPQDEYKKIKYSVIRQIHMVDTEEDPTDVIEIFLTDHWLIGLNQFAAGTVQSAQMLRPKNWIAVKIEDEWETPHIGREPPSCDLSDEYKIPRDISQCEE